MHLARTVPLSEGARLVLPEPGTDRDGAALLRLVAEQDVTTLQAVPAVLDALLEHPAIHGCRALRRVFCGGEPLSPELADRFFARLSAELHHVYGPTEAAIETTHWRCVQGAESAVVPIGRPIANATVHTSFLDRLPEGVDRGQPVGFCEVDNPPSMYICRCPGLNDQPVCSLAKHRCRRALKLLGAFERNEQHVVFQGRVRPVAIEHPRHGGPENGHPR
jgi:acyl-coenzyme A synthetase/AMP-(fatty) acid ligase